MVNGRHFRIDSGHLEADKRIGGQGCVLSLAAHGRQFFQSTALCCCGRREDVVLLRRKINYNNGHFSQQA
jgi:hypothetical protein